MALNEIGRYITGKVSEIGTYSDVVDEGGKYVAQVAAQIELPSFSAAPTFSLPVLVGVQVGAITIPQTVVSPTFSTPDLGVAGVFALPGFTVSPTFSVPELDGQQTGNFVMPATSPVPTFNAPDLQGSAVAAGLIRMPAFNAAPYINLPILIGLYDVPEEPLPPPITAMYWGDVPAANETRILWSSVRPGITMGIRWKDVPTA